MIGQPTPTGPDKTAELLYLEARIHTELLLRILNALDRSAATDRGEILDFVLTDYEDPGQLEVDES